MNAERAQLARRADVLLPRQAVDDQVHATNGRQAGHPISVGFGLGDKALEVLECQMHPEVIPEWRQCARRRGGSTTYHFFRENALLIERLWLP